MRTITRGAALLAVAALCATTALAETFLLGSMGDQRVSRRELAGDVYSYSGFGSSSSTNPSIATSFTDCTVTNGVVTITGLAAADGTATRYISSLTFERIAVASGRIALTGYFPDTTSVSFSEVTGTVAAGQNLFDMEAFTPQRNVSVTVRDSSVSWAAGAGGRVVKTPPQVSVRSAIFLLNVAATNAVSILDAGSVHILSQSTLAVDACRCNSCSGALVSIRGTTLIEDHSLLRVTQPVVSGSSSTIIAAQAVSVTANSLMLVDKVAQPAAALCSGVTVTKDPSSTVTLRSVRVGSLGATFQEPALQDVVVGGSAASALPAFIRPTVLDASGKASGACYPAECIPGNYNGLGSDCSCSCGTFYEKSCTALYDPLAEYRVICDIADCAMCATSKTCAECAPGYTLSSDKNSCVRPTSTTPPASCRVANCAQCMLNDPNRCSVCRDGYLLTAAYQCAMQNINIDGAAGKETAWIAGLAFLLASALVYAA